MEDRLRISPIHITGVLEEKNAEIFSSKMQKRRRAKKFSNVKNYMYTQKTNALLVPHIINEFTY